MSVDIFEVGNFLESVVFGVVFEDLIERIADEQGVLELRQFSQLVEFIPGFDSIIWIS